MRNMRFRRNESTRLQNHNHQKPEIQMIALFRIDTYIIDGCKHFLEKSLDLLFLFVISCKFSCKAKLSTYKYRNYAKH